MFLEADLVQREIDSDESVKRRCRKRRRKHLDPPTIAELRMMEGLSIDDD